MLSYWEQQSFTAYDHIVIGSGIVGLSTAIELKERYPGAAVLVLERGLLPTGASTRNAGFACMGSATELLDDLASASEKEVLQLFEARKLGLEKLRSRLGDAHIGYAENGSHELIGEAEEAALDKIDYLNNLLRPVTGQPAFKIASERISEFGFSPVYVKALVQNTCEGELHTGMMMRALVNMALQLGVEIKTGAEAIRFEEHEDHVAVEVKDPFRNETWLLHGVTLCICTNAFTKQLLPAVDVRPGRGQVLITEPIAGLKFKGIFHFDEGYYYFREIDGRILIGGGRHLDFEYETSTELTLTGHIQKELEEKLEDIIIPGSDYKVAMRWSGIMAFGESKKPIVQAFSERVFGAFRLGGMGVALGSNVAEQLAGLVARVVN